MPRFLQLVQIFIFLSQHLIFQSRPSSKERLMKFLIGKKIIDSVRRFAAEIFRIKTFGAKFEKQLGEFKLLAPNLKTSPPNLNF
jgi:hypothetical protein